MQLAMNNDQATVSAAKLNRFGEWIHSVTQKVTGLFKKPKKETPKFTYATVTDAIKFIEWRTRYDQQRIVRYIYTASLQKDNPELYRALNMCLPIKHFWSDEKVRIIKTDNSFERKLVRFFGELKPATKQLLDGKKTETQRWAKENARITELYLNRPPMHDTSKSLNGYEQQIVNALIASISTVPITTAPALLLPGTVTASVRSEEKIEVAAIDIVTQTLPIEEITQQPIENKAVTVTETEKLEKTIKGLKKLSLPDLKKFAIANNIHIRGKMTQITSIREKIVRELRKQAASQA